MNAHLIISTEYRANQPAVFIFADGKYYGNLTYPMLRKYPEDVNYWRYATCADSDRFFKVSEVVFSDDEFKKINSLTEQINAFCKKDMDDPRIWETQQEIRNILLSKHEN